MTYFVTGTELEAVGAAKIGELLSARTVKREKRQVSCILGVD